MNKFKLAVLTIALAGSSLAMAQDKATLRLNWIAYGFHTPFYLGLQKGIYKKHGIDLTIGEGKGSASTVQVVASGGDPFGLSDSSSIITGNVRLTVNWGCCTTVSNRSSRGTITHTRCSVINRNLKASTSFSLSKNATR